MVIPDVQTFLAKPDRPTVAVLGLGQMGLVCAGILAGSGDTSEAGPPRAAGGPGMQGGLLQRPVHVRLWGRNASEAAQVAQTRRSPRLAHFTLPPGVQVCLQAREALMGADLVIAAIPVQFLRSALTEHAAFIPDHVGIVSVSKGIEEGTLLRPSEIVADVLGRTGRDDPDRRPRPIGTLSGPTIAAELSRCLPAAMVAASDDEAFARQIQVLFTCSWLRVYTSTDLLGVELAGAVKNVIAIAAGVIDGLRAGNNAKSALLARGMAEIARLGVAMGASQQTFAGIAGVGDLATSCFSPEGRNRSLGEAIGRGLPADGGGGAGGAGGGGGGGGVMDVEAYLRQSPSVVEGVYTTRAVVQLAEKYRVEVPIVRAVHAVLFEKVDPLTAIGALMSRAARPERDEERA